jgi:histidine phosphotransfer protein HptB
MSGGTAAGGWAQSSSESPLNDLPVLDPQPLRDLLEMGAAPALVQELVALYQEDVSNRLALLRVALQATDAQQAMSEAHQLKGALGNLGLLRFADLAARLEQYVREGQLGAAARMSEALPAAYDEALRALLAEFPA